jgi:hypothetical protein
VKTLLQFIRGASLGSLMAGVFVAVALVAGLSEGANRLVFIGVAGAGMIYQLIPGRKPVINALGSLGVAILGCVSGIVSGFGLLEVALIAGGLIASLWLLRSSSRAWSLSPRLSSALSLIIVLAALIPLVIGGETLGHDESAYALKARSWLEGTPDTGWSLHRAPALSVYGYLILAAGGEEAALRSIGVLALAGLAGATWWLGARMLRGAVGPLAAIVVVAGPAIQRRATEYLTDIPSAALLVVCMVIVWREYEERTGGPSFRLLWLLPFAWGAFYLRYQSVLAFGLIGLSVLVLWWPKVKRKPVPLLATALLGLVGLIPHFAFSTSETGSPLGIIGITGSAGGREYLGEGLVDYALLSGWHLFGLLGLPVVVSFVWWSIDSWSTRGDRLKSSFLAIPAVGQVLTLGVLSHGEARFIFFPMALMSIGAVAGFIDLSSRWSSPVRAGTRLALISLLIGSLALSIAASRRAVDSRIRSNEPIELSAEFVGEGIEGRECAVLTSYAPQVTFYSECHTDIFRAELDAESSIARMDGGEKFMILVEDGKRQPTGDDLNALIARTESGPWVVAGERSSAEVYEFASD